MGKLKSSLVFTGVYVPNQEIERLCLYIYVSRSSLSMNVFRNKDSSENSVCFPNISFTGFKLPVSLQTQFVS